jgi:WD40 repeat protein
LALWNVISGERLALFETEEIFSAAISSDAELAVLGTNEGQVTVLRMADGVPVGEPYTHDLPLPREDDYETDEVEDGDDAEWEDDPADEDETEPAAEPRPGAVVRLVLTPDDRVAISQVWRAPIALVEVATGRRLATLDGSEHATSRFRLSPDGSIVVAGGREGGLLAWEVPSGRVRAMDASPAEVTGEVAVADHLAVAITEADGRYGISVWDLATGRCVRTISGPGNRWDHPVLSPDGRFGAVAGHDVVYAFDATSDAPAVEVGRCDDDAGIDPVRMLADGRVITGGDDGMLGLWGPGEGLLLSGHGGRIRHVLPVAGGDRVVSVGDGQIGVWDLTKVGDTDRTDHHRHAVGAIAIDPDGTVLTLANHGSEGHRWRLRDGRHIEVVKFDAALSQDGRYAITGSGEPMFGQTFATISPRSDRRRAAHTGGHGNLVLTVATDEKRRRLVGVTDRGVVYVWPLRWHRPGWWRPRRPRAVFGHPYWISGYAMSDDGRRGVLVFDQKTALVWDVDQAEQLRWQPDVPVGTAAVSANGDWCVFAGDGVLTLWNVDEATNVGVVEAGAATGDSDWLYCWHLAPDGSFALASDAEALLRRFELRDGVSGGAVAVDARIVSLTASGDDVVVGTRRGDVIALRYHPGAEDPPRIPDRKPLVTPGR